MTKELEVTKEIINFIEKNGAETVTEYSMWMAHSSQALIVVGLAFLSVSVISLIVSFFQYEKFGAVLLAVICFLTGSLFIARNYPTLMEPEAYAIHQLITDVRG